MSADSDLGVLRELDSPSPVLAITFGGMLMRVDGMPPFEFHRVLADAAPAKKLFLRDHLQAYYHQGVRGLADDIAGVEAGLREAIEEAGASRVVMMGGSGGGYAALLFGRLLGADEVHAFAPTTFLRADLREQCGDDRFQERWDALMASGRYQPRYGDLRGLFRETPNRGTRFVIHYPAGYEVDVFHADRLAAEPEVELRAHKGKDHRVVRQLRESGELRQLLRSALAG